MGTKGNACVKNMSGIFLVLNAKNRPDLDPKCLFLILHILTNLRSIFGFFEAQSKLFKKFLQNSISKFITIMFSRQNSIQLIVHFSIV